MVCIWGGGGGKGAHQDIMEQGSERYLYDSELNLLMKIIHKHNYILFSISHEYSSVMSQ